MRVQFALPLSGIAQNHSVTRRYVASSLQTTEVAAFQRLPMERAGFEPATSGLQTHPITRRHLMPTDGIGTTRPKSAFSSNAI